MSGRLANIASIARSTAISSSWAGQTYDRGLGTQSTTFLAYRVEPGDRRFQALVGVDERAGPLGQRRLSRARRRQGTIQDPSHDRS